MIRFNHVYKSFGKLDVLIDIDIELTMGKVVALIGPNASGKTTFIKSILGMVIPDRGSITFDNQLMSGNCLYRRQIGYMPQIGRYPENMRIQQVVDMISDISPSMAGRDEELMETFKLKAIGQKFMRTLSGGTRQKVSAALAFMTNAPVLILDEPTAGLDPLCAEQLKQKIMQEKEQGKLIIISSHVLSELEAFATDILYLADGHVHAYRPIDQLLEETNSTSVSSAILQLMQQHDGNW
jgi:Cu-processing system ATP-binding protein